MPDIKKMKLKDQSVGLKNLIKVISPFWKYGDFDPAVKKTLYNAKSFWEAGANCYKKALEEHSWFWDIEENIKEDTEHIDNDDFSRHKHHKKHHKKCHKKCPKSKLRGIQAQLVNSVGQMIDDGSNVIFDTLINDKSKAISYNSITGEFTINATGNYYVTWWVAADGTAGHTNVTFVVNKNSGGSIYSSSPSVTGQVVGSALITVDTKPTIITLVNKSICMVAFAATPVQANIIITEVFI